MPNIGRKKGKRKKFAGRNAGPARARYWQGGKLGEHKIKSLMLHNGMTRAEASRFWRDSRKGRIKG